MHGIQLIPGGQEIFQLLFADDVVLLSSTPRGLQKQINNLENASRTLGLTVNLEKTKVMVFRKGGFLSKYEKWTYAEQSLEVVNQYKYLGFTLTTRLSETSACVDFANKAKRKTFDILKTMWALGSLNTTIFFQLYDSQVKPMLLYAAEVWGYTKVDIVEKAHLFACKRLLGLNDTSPNQMVYGETGRYPILIDATIATVRYWLKLTKMQANRLPKQALHSMEIIMERDEEDKRVCWLKNIKRCLLSNGFDDVWYNRGVQNEKEFLRLLKNKMIETFKTDWEIKLKTSDRFVFYNSFKSSHHKETYLDELTIKKFRDTLLRFRLGLNELKTNNWFKENQNDTCPFCPDKVENEYHLVYKCATYEHLRIKYLRNYFSLEDLDIVSLLQEPDPPKIRQLAMYLFYCFQERRELTKLP